MRLIYCLLIGLVVFDRIEAQTKKPRIYYLHIKSDIRFRFATTVVTSKVVNPDLKSRETTFEVTLPNEAFISYFTLTVGTKTYVGNVTQKETARTVYEKDKSKGKSAAHVSVKRPRETNTFRIQINVAAGKKVTFELRYQELLERKLGSYNHVIYVKPGEPVADLTVELHIEESRNITTLRVSPIKSKLFTIKTQKDADAVTTITRPSAKRAHILFNPTINTQITQGGPNGLDCQIKVKYDVARKPDGGEILMVNGYFVHFFAPTGVKPKPKDVVFILDKSGSMKGQKLKQVKQAMTTILSKIKSDERLNILTFSSTVHPWEVVQKLIPATATNIKQAAIYVNDTIANGGTNIEGAIRRGVSLLSKRTDKKRAPVLLFLTDGEPTIGETNPEIILKNVKRFNKNKSPIFALAFGRRADYNFIKRLAAQNKGFGRKIYEDFDAAEQISNFYSEISTMVLQNVTFKYLPGSVNVKTLTVRKFPNMFEGSEVVVAGMMASETMYDLNPYVVATDLNGHVSLDVPIDGVVRLNFTTNKEIYAITEKIWAYVKIKQWLQQMYAATNELVQEGLRQEITKLALKYNFVTPFTSIVVSLPHNIQSSPADPLLDSPEPDFAHIQGSSARNNFVQQSSNMMSLSQDVSLFNNNEMLSSDPSMMDLFDVIDSGPTLATVLPGVGSTGVSNTGSSGISGGATSSGTSTGSNNNFKNTLPLPESTSGYTLVGVKGITTPLCVENPSKAEQTKLYSLFQDLDSDTTVSVEFTHSQSDITRITYVKIVGQTVTELFPTHIVENTVRRDWNTNTFYTYVHGVQGSGVKLEVTSLSNNKLVVHFDFTENSFENIDGSLALPIRGEIKDNHNLQGFPNDQMKELSLLAKKSRKVRMMIPVELSSVMNCWIVRSSLFWTLKSAI